ncbi:unnamed protein product [Paramecium sonneborni]|uniref:Uncharacterized protein n=1 Tax=Paramecium sonneborni TaxID=65129 RepID=A0A8S1RNH0_9CILI|nr:unnamed protein product [Paramecium sonneborni]
MQVDQNWIKEEYNQIKEENNQIKKENKNIQEQMDILIKQDRLQIDLSLKDLDKPENQHQKTYYRSLFWRLFNYLSAMSQIATDLYKINTNAIIESNSEKVLQIVQKCFNVGAVVSGLIPVVGDVFGIINALLDSAIDTKNENKFNRRLRLLNEILQLFAVNPSQLEIEVQMTAILLGKQQLPNIKERKRTEFSQRVDKLIVEESGSSKDIYWIQGTEDALIILKYLEKNQEQILKQPQKKLREIFQDAVKSYQYIAQAPRGETGCSQICQLI